VQLPQRAASVGKRSNQREMQTLLRRCLLFANGTTVDEILNSFKKLVSKEIFLDKHEKRRPN
jgi:hypothetical protein